MEEWQPAGIIMYTALDHIPRLKIITSEHTYEMQASKFDPLMQVFAVLVDGEFHASKHDSLDRLMQLDEASKSKKCSERERLLANQIKELKEQIMVIIEEKEQLEQKYNDSQIIIFDGV